jgi:hypothetical protein
MFRKIENGLRKTRISNLYHQFRDLKTYREWIKSGKPTPPPHIVKRMAVKQYANKFQIKTFVETGTYFGDMVDGVKRLFETIYSIELDKGLYKQAQSRFEGEKNIHLIRGDSSVELQKIITEIETPTLFWLDGHFSGGVTARGDKSTPILEELECILGHPIEGHVILIDDARCYTGRNDFPPVAELREMIQSKWPEYRVTVDDDIIRVCNDSELPG